MLAWRALSSSQARLVRFENQVKGGSRTLWNGRVRGPSSSPLVSWPTFRLSSPSSPHRENLSLSLPPFPLSPDRAPAPTNHREHPIRVPKRALAVFHVRVVVLVVLAVVLVSTWPLVQRASNGAPLSPVP